MHPPHHQAASGRTETAAPVIDAVGARAVPPRAAPPPDVPPLVSAGALHLALALTVAAMIAFTAAPQLDLEVAAAFYQDGRFIGQGPLGTTLRAIIYWIPLGLCVTLCALWALRRVGITSLWAPSGRGALFLAVSLAVGPGLLVNVGLKDHWHRPRPVQVTDFGGNLAFVPWYRTDGACARNCSFVSGEGSAAVWTLAPALLAPAAYAAPAVGAALVFALTTSLLRIAFGGHFLSDTVFAALFTWLVLILCWRLILGRRGPR